MKKLSQKKLQFYKIMAGIVCFTFSSLSAVIVFLPSDPGVLSRMNRNLIVKRKASQLGFHKYDLMASFEHRNHYWGLKAMVEEVFSDWDISRRYYPFGIRSANMSLFSIWQVRKPE